MKISLLTNEYPPHIYGGAGVHIENLTREMANLEDRSNKINVLCFGEQKEDHENTQVRGISPILNLPSQDSRHAKLMDTLVRNVVMSGSLSDTDIVHCHTWYTHFAGCILKNLLNIPLVLTTHSLEPCRPWKKEQLGSAYEVSTWIEKTAYENADGVIAVSESMKKDVHQIYNVSLDKICVIYNGINIDLYKPTFNEALVHSYNIDPNKPYILFVGRITRQKGIIHLVKAIQYIKPDLQIVLCAGAPDTEEIKDEMVMNVEKAQQQTNNKIIWIPEILPQDHLINIYTHAAIFVCPSIYEPFGLINLEAMACETPVIASSVGGIPEVVKQDDTGLLVPFEPAGIYDSEPKYPERFAQDIASAINNLISMPDKIQTMGKKSRKRVEDYFSWQSIAQKTLNFYRDLIKTDNSSL